MQVQLSGEPTADLGLVVTFEAEDGQVFQIVIRWIVVNVMDLQRLSCFSAHAARSVGCK